MKKVNISYIAKLTGYSKATVSLVLNGDKRVAESTRRKVLEAIKKYNFIPDYYARKLSFRNSRELVSEIAIVAPRSRSVFVSSIFSEMEEIFYKDGEVDIRFSFYSTVGLIEIKRQLLNKLLYGRIADVIVAITIRPDDEILKEAKEKGIHFILIENESPYAYSILVDNKKGVKLALDHLKKIGRKDIVLIVGTPNVDKGAEPNPTAIIRLNSALEWFKRNNMSVEKKIFYVKSYIFEEGYQLVDEILSKNPTVDAIFSAAGDIVASGVLERLKEKGIEVPKHIAIVGYDNYKLICENTQPKLTTVDQKLPLIARYTHSIIKDLKENKQPNKNLIKIIPELIIRESA